jgi:hypothetical protein
MQAISLAAPCLLAVVLVAALGGCGERSSAAPVAPPRVVKVTPGFEQDVPISIEYVRTLVGYVNAQIRARVPGQLVSQNYTRGMRLFVRYRGQSLTIDREGDVIRVHAMHCQAPSIRVAVNGDTHERRESETRLVALR